MNSKSIRRLAADHGSLHTAGLPPNYLFPPSSASDPSSDLTSLDVLLAGPTGTPYSKGVWRLHLDIPTNYPTAPPTATFRTRLWHPNVDESSGAVCVETLKRDWSSDLRLRDVLVTISCLLIQPNPASALNEAAGQLANEDWGSFCRRAKLMTEIHAAVPTSLDQGVREAQMRGEEQDEGMADGEGETNNVSGEQIVVPNSSRAEQKVRASVAEDEENLKRSRLTAEPESDPESDWIPGPTRSPKPFAATGRENMLGIRGLEDSMQIDTPSTNNDPDQMARLRLQEEEAKKESSTFITVTSRESRNDPFGLRAAKSVVARQNEETSVFDSKLKFSDQNPYSAIEPPRKTRKLGPTLDEFSWTWEEAMVLNDTGFNPADVPTKEEMLKRHASEEFRTKQKWELKRFKKAGCDLKRYNRGDWGPRMGARRL
ncbi:UBC-like protein [Polyplosphaeria fusca]|uniref:UBC-like protein n=1 Tax=Polyplosphaeria fusca TaxID=682080 RepID=A0A9P4R279_9PLEO|nr:UBC-like protein [Polyplosphaeria fusca]